MAWNKWVNDTGTITYNSWRSMRNRVLYDSCENHKFYKVKGIQICQRWIDSFDHFVEDMGFRPDGTSLDRIDPDGDYKPSNCRWADTRVQQNNKHNLTKIEKDGVVKTIGEWAYALGLSERQKSAIYKRHSLYGAKTYDELFSGNLYSYRKSIEQHVCVVCKTTESTKWRKSTCANCYARALRYYRKLKQPIDIAGYATLAERACEAVRGAND